MRSEIRGAMLALGLAMPNAVFAAPLDFDCDVPPNHYSSVASTIVGAPTVAGTVRVVEMRSGDNLPVAGTRLVSVDGATSVGFQLVAPSPGSKKFDIALNVNRGDPQRKILGQIDAAAPIQFSLSVSPAGQISLVIGENKFNAGFVPMSESKAMVFCSTGQFKFTNLFFSPAS